MSSSRIEQQLSDQENLILHAEVVALQQKLGISYKDASHQLYMAELEKLKVAELMKHIKHSKISTSTLQSCSNTIMSILVMTLLLLSLLIRVILVHT